MTHPDRRSTRTHPFRRRAGRLVALFLLGLTAAQTAVAQTAPDLDGDGFDDASDNCREVANPQQRDTDGDGFGNACDADYDQDGLVTTADFGGFFAAFQSGVGTEQDHTGDGAVTTADFGTFYQQFMRGAPGPGAELAAFSEKGWIPTPDGPVWGHYVVDGELVRWEDDLRFDLTELREYQATVTRRRPIEIVSYDIDNGTYQYDDSYRGGTGDGSVATRVYPSFELSTLAGGRGKLVDGAWPDTDTHRQIRDGMAVTWGDWTGAFQVSPMVFRLEEHTEIGSVVIRGANVSALEVTIGGTTLSRSYTATSDPQVLHVDAQGGLGLSGDEVVIRLPEMGATFYEVEVFGMPPLSTGDGSTSDAVTVSPDRGWRNGDVPYELVGFPACTSGTSCARTQMEDAIAHWEASTVYDFTEDANATPRIRIRYCDESVSGQYCEEATARGVCFVVGAGRPANDDVRKVFVRPNGCGFGTSVHEIGHAIGLYHEQAHRERDEFVRVNWENIQDDSWATNQYKFKGTSFGDYNYRSIMHYGVSGFAKQVCCSVATIDTTQDGLPASCQWYDDVKVTFLNSNDEQQDRCPAFADDDMLDLPNKRTMQTMVPDPGLPITRSDVQVGQRRELSKGDITAANALTLGDFRARSYHSLFDVALVDFAPGASAYAIGDVNADGRDDLIAFSNHIYVALGQPDGTVVDDGIWFANVYCHSERQCVVGDPDADGRDDVVSFHEDGPVEVFWSNGENAFYRYLGAEVSHPTFGRRAQYGSAFFLADVDGDCVDDAVAIDVAEYLGAKTIRVALSTGGKLSAFDVVEDDWLTFTTPLGGARGWSFGDVDRDGKDDFQAGRTIYRSNGNGFDPGTEWAPTDYRPAGWCTSGTICQLADVDGDERADLVEIYTNGATHQERLRYALSNGWEFRTEVPNYHELDCRNDSGCLFGDVDGDGYMDSIDAVRFELNGNDGPGREPGSIWISRARELWTDSIGPRNGSGIGGSTIWNQCGNPFPLPTL